MSEDNTDFSEGIMPEYELAPKGEYWVLECGKRGLVGNIPVMTFPSGYRDDVREFCDDEYDEWGFLDDTANVEGLDAVVTTVVRQTKEEKLKRGTD